MFGKKGFICDNPNMLFNTHNRDYRKQNTTPFSIKSKVKICNNLSWLDTSAVYSKCYHMFNPVDIKLMKHNNIPPQMTRGRCNFYEKNMFCFTQTSKQSASWLQVAAQVRRPGVLSDP